MTIRYNLRTSKSDAGSLENAMFQSILVPVDLTQPSSCEPVLPEAIAACSALVLRPPAQLSAS